MAKTQRQVVWAWRALDQLHEIAEYIALDNVDAAGELVAKCLHATDQLVLFPESGRRVPEDRQKRYRELIVPPCRIIYRSEGNDLIIVHVLRGEQRLRRKRLR
jgi:plasmid stabilization system protein ParE